MRTFFTVTRLLVGIGIVAAGVIIGLAIATVTDDGDSPAIGASEELATSREGVRDAAPTVEDLGFEAGVSTAELAGSLGEVVSLSNGVSRLQDDALIALDRGLTRFGNGDGPGAEAMFDGRAGGFVTALDRAVSEEASTQGRAEGQLDQLSAVLDRAEGDLNELRPVAEAAKDALASTADLVALDDEVARRVGAMRTALLENRVPRYRRQAFALAGLLDDAEKAGTAVNRAQEAFAAAAEQASELLADLGVDRVLSAG